MHDEIRRFLFAKAKEKGYTWSGSFCIVLTIGHVKLVIYLIMAEYLTGRLLIADTNNSVIRYIDLNDKNLQLLTLELKGVEPPSAKPKSLKRLRRRLPADVQIIKVDAGKAKEGYLSLQFSVPDGYHFSKVSDVCLFFLFHLKHRFRMMRYQWSRTF